MSKTGPDAKDRVMLIALNVFDNQLMGTTIPVGIDIQTINKCWWGTQFSKRELRLIKRNPFDRLAAILGPQFEFQVIPTNDALFDDIKAIIE